MGKVVVVESVGKVVVVESVGKVVVVEFTLILLSLSSQPVQFFILLTVIGPISPSGVKPAKDWNSLIALTVC